MKSLHIPQLLPSCYSITATIPTIPNRCVLISDIHSLTTRLLFVVFLYHFKVVFDQPNYQFRIVLCNLITHSVHHPSDYLAAIPHIAFFVCPYIFNSCCFCCHFLHLYSVRRSIRQTVRGSSCLSLLCFLTIGNLSIQSFSFLGLGQVRLLPFWTQTNFA